MLDTTHKLAIGSGMSEQADHAALEREQIAARLANFKATQQRFQRERDEYFLSTLERSAAPAD
jgi:hypothetical protein